ncbi:MAG: four helix bundle protein [Planctomycetales bacterium]|nr:four helix bundle protein [Planctomycetales bacterium]
MRSHEDLDVWRSGIDLVDRVYDLCRSLPVDERFGLISQLQRASVSVPANIAEGCGRDSTKDLLRHLAIAQGSLAEARTLLVIVRRRGFAKAAEVDEVDTLAQSVARMLVGLQRAMRRKLDSQ